MTPARLAVERSETFEHRGCETTATFGLGIQGHVSLQCPGFSIVSEIGAFCPASVSRASQISLWFPAVGQSTGKGRAPPIKSWTERFRLLARRRAGW
jgi:hypothetical protein